MRRVGAELLLPVAGEPHGGLWGDGTDFETLLSVLLKGSPYSYYTERGIWIFGAAASDGLSSATVLPLVYRSVSKVEEIIPEALKQTSR